MRERLVDFRGREVTITLDSDGNWWLYDGEEPIEDLSDKETQEWAEYVYEWRVGDSG